MNPPGASPAASSPAAAAVPSAAQTPARQPESRTSDRVPALVWAIAAAFVALELAVSGRYGFQQDELYFIEAGRHLSLGYVDQPPLIPLLNRFSTDLFGLNPTAVRIIPALTGAFLAVVAARFAALFGAAGSVAYSPRWSPRAPRSSSARRTSATPPHPSCLPGR